VSIVASAYRAEWSLFIDWCQATDRSPLGTDAATVKVFLDDCPSAAATARRRISAINRAHGDAGYSGYHLRGHPSAAVTAMSAGDTAARAAVLMQAFGRIPAYGWPSSVAGRRDGCLLSLAATGMARPQLRSLAVGDITAEPGVVRVSPPGGAALTSVHTGSDGSASCPACGITRWHRVLALQARHGLPGIRSRLADPPERSVGHHCARPLLDGAHPRMSLLPRVSARGLIDSTGPAISARTISTVLSCRTGTPDPVVVEHATNSPQHRAPLDPDVAATRRAEAVAALADVTDVLDAVELEAELAMARLAELVAGARRPVPR